MTTIQDTRALLAELHLVRQRLDTAQAALLKAQSDSARLREALRTVLVEAHVFAGIAGGAVSQRVVDLAERALTPPSPDAVRTPISAEDARRFLAGVERVAEVMATVRNEGAQSGIEASARMAAAMGAHKVAEGIRALSPAEVVKVPR